RPPPNAKGPQAGAPDAARPPPRRALDGAAHGGEPAHRTDAAAVLAEDVPLEELLHRRGRRAEGLGAAGTAPPARPRARSGPAMARGASRGARRPGRDLSCDVQRGPGAPMPRISGRPPAH